MTIRSSGGSDLYDWGNFYNQGIAVLAKCVRRGRRGAAIRLGEFIFSTDVECFQLMNRVGAQLRLSLEISAVLSTDPSSS